MPLHVFRSFGIAFVRSALLLCVRHIIIWKYGQFILRDPNDNFDLTTDIHHFDSIYPFLYFDMSIYIDYTVLVLLYSGIFKRVYNSSNPISCVCENGTFFRGWLWGTVVMKDGLDNTRVSVLTAIAKAIWVHYNCNQILTIYIPQLFHFITSYFFTFYILYFTSLFLFLLHNLNF
jgi:hypothetical protein